MNLDEYDYYYVCKCVNDLNGVWPDYCERYLLWDEKLGWNYIKGVAVYYAHFREVCEALGMEFRYGYSK